MSLWFDPKHCSDNTPNLFAGNIVGLIPKKHQLLFQLRAQLTLCALILSVILEPADLLLVADTVAVPLITAICIFAALKSGTIVLP